MTKTTELIGTHSRYSNMAISNSNYKNIVINKGGISRPTLTITFFVLKAASEKLSVIRNCGRVVRS